MSKRVFFVLYLSTVETVSNEECSAIDWNGTDIILPHINAN